MSIRPRGKKFLVDVGVGKDRIRKSADTMKEAKELEAKLRSCLLSGEQVVTKRTRRTLSELRTATMRDVWAGSKSERATTRVSEELVRRLGAGTELAAIDTPRVYELIAELKKEGNCGGTINRKLSNLSKMLSHAVELGWLNSKPVIRRQRESDHRIRFLSDEEEKLVLQTLRKWGKIDEAELVEFLLDTGARVDSDALSLEWRDVHFKNRVVVFPDRKAGNTTGVPMTNRVLALLSARKLKKLKRPFEGLHYETARKAWDRVREHLGLGDDTQFVLHACRHTFCSRLVQGGASLPVVKELAGHASITMTMRYSHLAPKHLESAISILDKQA